MGWIISIATIVFIVYGMIPFLDKDLVPEIDSIFRISYGTFSSFAWALVVCWVVFACINGYGGLQKNIYLFVQFIFIFYKRLKKDFLIRSYRGRVSYRWVDWRSLLTSSTKISFKSILSASLGCRFTTLKWTWRHFIWSCLCHLSWWLSLVALQ